MDDFKEKLMQILNDPGRMEQIASLAGVLTERSDENETQPLTFPTAEAMEGIRQIMQQVGRHDEKQEALVEALSPYLRPQRRQRLQRAIQIARLSQVAGAALRTQQNENMAGGGERV